MTAPPIVNPEAMQVWWGVPPVGVAHGSSTGLSAAAWRHHHAEPRELAPDPDPLTHVVTPFVSGSVDSELIIDGRRRYRSKAGAGDFHLARAGETWRGVTRDADFACLHLYVPDLLLRGFVENDMERDASGLELRQAGLEQDVTLAWVGRELAAEMRGDHASSRLVVDAMALLTAAHLVRRWSNMSLPPDRVRGGLAPHLFRRACAYLDEHIADDVTLQDVARLVGLSTKHFARAFRESSGLPPHQWVLARRVERAKTLLRDPETSLAAVALACGFSDQSHFTNRFRRATGLTPARFRAEITS